MLIHVYSIQHGTDSFLYNAIGYVDLCLYFNNFLGLKLGAGANARTLLAVSGQWGRKSTPNLSRQRGAYITLLVTYRNRSADG